MIIVMRKKEFRRVERVVFFGVFESSRFEVGKGRNGKLLLIAVKGCLADYPSCRHKPGLRLILEHAISYQWIRFAVIHYLVLPKYLLIINSMAIGNISKSVLVMLKYGIHILPLQLYYSQVIIFERS